MVFYTARKLSDGIGGIGSCTAISNIYSRLDCGIRIGKVAIASNINFIPNLSIGTSNEKPKSCPIGIGIFKGIGIPVKLEGPELIFMDGIEPASIHPLAELIVGGPLIAEVLYQISTYVKPPTLLAVPISEIVIGLIAFTLKVIPFCPPPTNEAEIVLRVVWAFKFISVIINTQKSIM